MLCRILKPKVSSMGAHASSMAAVKAFSTTANASSVALAPAAVIAVAAGAETLDPYVPTAGSAVRCAGQSVQGVRVVTDAQATDALAAEALDATEGAFPTVADAIEVGLDSVTPSGFDPYVSTADPSVDRQTVPKPGFQTASKAPLAMHIQAPAATKPSAVTPSGIASDTSFTVDSTVKCAGSASLWRAVRASSCFSCSFVSTWLHLSS